MAVSNSIVVVNFNGQLPLLAFLKALKLNEALSTEVLVVDNGSFDDSVKMIRQHFPGVRVLEQAANRGFWAGANKGIDQASGDVIVLCHTDVLADVHALAELADQAREAAGRKVVAVVPLLMGVDGEEQPTLGPIPSTRAMLAGALVPARGGTLTTPSLEHLQDTQWARFVCVALTRDALTTVGGFDERFFFFGGDVDWCGRMHRKQLRLLFSRSVRVVHVGAASTKFLPPHLQRLVGKDQQAYAGKYLPGWLKPVVHLAQQLRAKLGQP